MAPASLDTQQAVYLALRGVFIGKLAKLREKKAIRRLVKLHQEGDIDLLVQKYTLEGVIGVTRSLLLEEVFESESKAKERFPCAFDNAVVGTADEAPEQLGTVPGRGASEKAPTCQRCGNSDIVVIADSIGLQVANTARDTSSRPAEGAPPNEWLFPIFLPFETQHAIMIELQRTLECACFVYGQQFLPSLLKSRRWTCAAAVELNRWADEFQQRSELLLASSTMSADALIKLLRSIAYIRQVSVHRIDISATRLGQCIEDAQKLAHLLQSRATAEALGQLRDVVRVELERLEKERTSLLQKFTSLRQGIESDRMALDQREEKAVAAVEEQDAGFLKRVGEGIQNAIFDFQLTKPMVPAVESSHNVVSDDDADIVVC